MQTSFGNQPKPPLPTGDRFPTKPPFPKIEMISYRPEE